MRCSPSRSTGADRDERDASCCLVVGRVRLRERNGGDRRADCRRCTQKCDDRARRRLGQTLRTWAGRDEEPSRAINSRLTALVMRTNCAVVGGRAGAIVCAGARTLQTVWRGGGKGSDRSRMNCVGCEGWAGWRQGQRPFADELRRVRGPGGAVGSERVRIGWRMRQLGECRAGARSEGSSAAGGRCARLPQRFVQEGA